MWLLMKEIDRCICESKLKEEVDKWPLHIMQALVNDIVHLEKNQSLGIQYTPESSHDILIRHVCCFIDHASMEMWKKGEFMAVQMNSDDRISHQDQKEEEEEEEENSTDDESKSSLDSARYRLYLQNLTAPKHNSNIERRKRSGQQSKNDEIANRKKKHALAKKFGEDDITYQLPEVYATLWSYERLLDDFLKTLAMIGDQPE
ncbi:hypothetical protein RFI_08417, partial [Reticulomyxa filosa]